MNTKVKNAIDQLLTACEQIENVPTIEKLSLTQLVIGDICSFIKKISYNNAEDRIALFQKTYLDSKLHLDPTKFGEFPCSTEVIAYIDNEIFYESSVKLSSLYLLTITEIGKSYLFSPSDKKDIDAQAFSELIQKINHYFVDCVINKPINDIKRTQLEKKISLEDDKSSKTESVIKKLSKVEHEDTLEELLSQLDDLIGLTSVKQEVHSLINLIKINKMKEERGIKTTDISKHLVFLGNPGTGKTTVARLLANIYKQIHVLEKGQLVEVDRASLVAGYVGQTALKTTEKINEAMGGILFIDEAYTLAKGGNDFGQEAIDTLLKAMEDHRDSFIVIVAGYPDLMIKFLESNPGLKSRFNKSILFEDYSQEELFAIFESLCRKSDLHLDEKAREALIKHLHELCINKPDNFANGREMRNLFERSYSNQANRLASLSSITNEAFLELKVEDLEIERQV